MRTLLVIAILIFISPIILPMIFAGLDSSLQDLLIQLQEITPILASVALAIATVGFFIGLAMYVFGHHHGKRMIKGSLWAALGVAGAGALFEWVGKVGPVVTNDLAAHMTTAINQALGQMP